MKNDTLPKARFPRPRGFIGWTPQTKTAELLGQVKQILGEYRDYLPLTIRQIFYRLAVVPSQIERYSLPTALPKATDHRAFDGDTVQAEALPPDILARIVENAILEELDTDLYDMAVKQEARDREALIEWTNRP